MKIRLEIIIGILLVLIICLGLLVSNKKSFIPLHEAFNTDSVPTGILSTGSFGKILKQLHLILITPNEGTRFPPTETVGTDVAALTFQKKRKVGESLYTINSEGMDGFKSTAIMKGISNKKNWPIFSIVTEDENLNDPARGILVNVNGRGQEWERPAEFTFIEDGNVRFATSVGLRLHGGVRRGTSTYNSYRIYFRNQYGIRSLPSDLIFPSYDDSTPVRTIVLHTTDWPPGYPMNNPLAYDIAGKIGFIVPRTRLVEIYLNGKSQGMGIATEHMSRKQWGQRWDHDNFHFYRFRSEISNADQAMYVERLYKTISRHEPLTMEEVASSIDIDNFTQQMMSWVFCGTDDYCQGVAVLNKEEKDAKLFWIGWDMDGSFWDYDAQTNSDITRDNWQQPAFARYYRESHNCGRTKLFSRLLDESPEYKEFFLSFVTETLNHRLTKSFLASRVYYYKTMIEQFGEDYAEYIGILERFVENRPDFVREDMKQTFGLTGPFKVVVSSPADRSNVIDGFQAGTLYSGEYFAGQKCTLEYQDDGKDFSHWKVNGKQISSNPLQIIIEKDLEVEVVLHAKYQVLK